MNQEPFLVIKNLKKYFPLREGFFSRTNSVVKAVDGVSLQLTKGVVFGMVGESGCGKTTLGRTILRLIEPTDGEVWFEGIDLLNLKKKDTMRRMYRNMQLVFQDPYSSLHPRKIVRDLVGEGLLIHKIARKSQLNDRVSGVLEKVGLKSENLFRFPNEFSGGQRQRIAIARALILEPKFLVLDEPTSALDVSVQAQILNLLKELKRELGLTYLFISHDLSVIKYMCDRVAVMYLGKVVETGPAEAIFRNPLHPYSQILLSAIPSVDPDIQKQKVLLEGDPPTPIDPPPGCSFHTRCPKAMVICKEKIPELRELRKGQWVSCHLAE